jgi:hypothetical protein
MPTWLAKNASRCPTWPRRSNTGLEPHLGDKPRRTII